MGDDQTEAPGVLAVSGRSDALLWHMLPNLTCPVSAGCVIAGSIDVPLIQCPPVSSKLVLLLPTSKG